MRLYSVSFSAVAVSAAQDLINVTATSGMALKVHYIELGQKTLTAWEAKEIVCRRMPATVTAGSGGSSPTPRPFNPSDAAATFTAHANDTTAMTTSGTAETILARDWEFLNGFFWMPAPEQRPIIKPSQGFAINLPTAPSASMTASGTVWVEELF
jgi:hypothetical protein